MENQIDSFGKKNKVTERRKKYWVDLPDDILGLILSKLHFIDQIRFRAVCRSWRVSEDELTRCSDNIPWIITHTWPYSWDGDKVPFKCQLFDPYLAQVHQVPNSLSTIPLDFSVVYASKNGWLLIHGYRPGSFSSSLSLSSSSLFVMHNPFTNQVILLPHLSFNYAVATFSDESELFVLFRDIYGSNALYIGTYNVSSRDKNWSVRLIDELDAVCHSVQYVKRKLYLLYNYCELKSYNLADNYSPELPMSIVIPNSHWSSRYWLIENKGDLLIVWHDCVGWYAIRFDLSEMSWDFEPNLKNTALFISGNVSFSRPLTDINSGENIQDCRVFFVFNDYMYGHVNIEEDEDPCGRIFCFSFGERRLIDSREYSWIERSHRTTVIFIEPPH